MMDNNILDTLDPKLIGARLAAARQGAGLTRTQAVKLSEFPHVSLLRWEHGKERITAFALVKLALLYGCDVSDIVCEPLPFTSDKEAIDAFNRAEITEGTLAKWLKVDRIVARMRAQAELSKNCQHDWMDLGPNSRICTVCSKYDANI